MTDDNKRQRMTKLQNCQPGKRNKEYLEKKRLKKRKKLKRGNWKRRNKRRRRPFRKETTSVSEEESEEIEEPEEEDESEAEEDPEADGESSEGEEDDPAIEELDPSEKQEKKPSFLKAWRRKTKEGTDSGKTPHLSCPSGYRNQLDCRPSLDLLFKPLVHTRK